ncbi:high-potential iron-sulfur protein [Marinimicrobium sp. ARAG 43.8]|uniref:high-potential iron-sulfur protein n=1 Tax=Marinimicrobium sp. ARAG 43.8 TaxID=3418719 RepID=UPI003CF882BC
MKRRDFLKLSAATAGATLIPVHMIQAQEEHLSPEDPQAKALKYVEDSEIEGQHCNNCIHAKGDLEAEWVGCNLFPNKQVKGSGWCSVWAARG